MLSFFWLDKKEFKNETRVDPGTLDHLIKEEFHLATEDICNLLHLIKNEINHERSKGAESGLKILLLDRFLRNYFRMDSFTSGAFEHLREYEKYCVRQLLSPSFIKRGMSLGSGFKKDKRSKLHLSEHLRGCGVIKLDDDKFYVLSGGLHTFKLVDLKLATLFAYYALSEKSFCLPVRRIKCRS
jgi:hypothetical protein